MTRDYLWDLIREVFVFWFASEPGEQKEVKTILDNSSLIPKPKFKLGDKVKSDNGITATITDTITLEKGNLYQVYDPCDEAWRYLAFEQQDWRFYDESQLVLDEEVIFYEQKMQEEEE